MASHVPASLRRQVQSQAQGRCAYCQSHEALMGVTFEVDHIIPLSSRGLTRLDNLCLACPSCNRHKAGRTSAIDPETGEEAPLFHPRQDIWADHFAWHENGVKLIGLTATGRATIEALRMNRQVLVQVRRYWLALGLHPPV